jgi:hypothetical protein
MYTDFVNILVILSENCVSKDVRNKLESGLTYVQFGLEVVGGRVVWPQTTLRIRRLP